MVVTSATVQFIKARMGSFFQLYTQFFNKTPTLRQYTRDNERVDFDSERPPERFADA